MTRRAFLVSAAALALLLCSAATQAQAPPAGADWPQFRGNPTLTGVTPRPCRRRSRCAGRSRPATRSNPRRRLPAAWPTSVRRRASCWRSTWPTGKPRWRYKTVEGIGESSPAVSTALGLVFVGDLSGMVHAVRVADGQAAWTFKTKGEVKSSPVVHGDKVVVGSYDGSLYGLDIKSGTQAWVVHTENYVHGTPAIVDGIAYFAGCDEVFRAIRVSDGKDSATCRSAPTPARRWPWRTAGPTSAPSRTRCWPWT